jgi:hypothetical protein
MFLLPGLAKHDSVLAARIRDEHANIRGLLAEIGVGIELHIVRETQMLELAQFLREHAKMEEKPLYTWADTALPESSFGLVFRRLRAWQQTRIPATSPKERSTNTVPGAPRLGPLLGSSNTK